MASNLQYQGTRTTAELGQNYLSNLRSNNQQLRPTPPAWSTEARYDFNLVDDDLTEKSAPQVEPSKDSQQMNPSDLAPLPPSQRNNAVRGPLTHEKGSPTPPTLGGDGTYDEESQITLYRPRAAIPVSLASRGSAKFVASVMEAHRFNQHRRLYWPNTEAAIPCRREKGAYETMETPPQAARVPRLQARKTRKTIQYDLDVERYM